jgi:peroxiredoxin
MKRLSIGDQAPDFELPDDLGKLHRLSSIYEEKNVLLVFNLGFA